MKVNIFTPTYYRFQKTKKAIESIVKSVYSSTNDVVLYIGDNHSEDPEMLEWLISLKGEKVNVMFSNKNVGKALIVNEMYKKSRECDIVISIDSDMFDDNDFNWIDRLVHYLNIFPEFGLISTFQRGNNCHWLGKQDKVMEKNGMRMLYGTHYGVAGGCVGIRDSDWKIIGGYKAVDIYAGDDAWLMVNITNSGKLVGIAENVGLVHMINEPGEESYQKWKVDKCHGRLAKGFDKGFYDK